MHIKEDLDSGSIKGVYSLDLNGSPSKMVVLSAKNNHMLAELFKVSANYLVNSPSKMNKTMASHDKKKLNEDLIEQMEGTRIFSDAKNIQKTKNGRDKPPMKSNQKLREGFNSTSKGCTLRVSQQKENQWEKTLNQSNEAHKLPVEDQVQGESTALKFVKRAQERQASRVKQRESQTNKEQLANCIESNSNKKVVQERRQSTNLLATSVEKLQEIKYTNERLQKMKETYKLKRQEQCQMQLNPENMLDDTLRHMSQSFDQRVRQTKQMKERIQYQKSSSKKPQKNQMTSILSDRHINSLVKESQNSRQSAQKEDRYSSSLRSSSIKLNHNQSLQNSTIKEKAISNTVVKQIISQSFHHKAASTTVEIPRLNIQQPIIMDKPMYKTLDMDDDKRQQSPLGNTLVHQTFDDKAEWEGKTGSISEMMIKLMKIRQKIIKNQRDITFKTFIDFKRSQNPSLECQKAAKCLCKLLNIVNNPDQQTKQYTEWADYKNYYQTNSHKIVSDMSQVIQKCDIKQYSIEKVEALFKEVFYGTSQDLSTINSPKVKYSGYKNVLKYSYYCLCYILLHDKIQQLQKKQYDLKQKVLEKQSKNKTDSKAKKQLNSTMTISHISQEIAMKKEQVRHSSVIKLRKNEDMPLKRTVTDLMKTSINAISLRTSIQGGSVLHSRQGSTIRQSKDWSMANTVKMSPQRSLVKSAQKQNKNKSSLINSLKVSSRRSNDSSNAQVSFIKKKKTQNNSISNINQVYMTKQSLQQFDTLNYISNASSGGSEQEVKQNDSSQEIQDTQQEDNDQQIIDLPVMIDVGLATRNIGAFTQSSANSMPVVSCFQSQSNYIQNCYKEEQFIQAQMEQNIVNQSQVDEMNKKYIMQNTKLTTDKMEVIQRLKEERLKSKERVKGTDLEKKTYQIIYDLTRDIKKNNL